MANTTPSANMSLPIPTVGVDPGTDWASNLNSCLTLIDGHDHGSGSGVQITPSGLNINADLTFANNNLTNAKTLGMFTQSADPSTLGCLYYKGVDLYFNDGSSNHIRLTQSGAVSGATGTITGLPSGTASASYNSGNGTFVFQSATNTSANVDGQNFILRNNAVNSKGLTLSPPAAMGADVTVTLPTIPAQTNVMTLTSGGAMGSITYDAVGQGMTSTGANAIGVSMTSTGANAVGVSMTSTGANAVGVSMTSTGANAVAASRTRSAGVTEGTGGVGYSVTANFSTTSTRPTFVDVTNLTVTLTTSGRPVMLCFVSDQSNAPATAAYVDVSAGTSVVQGYVQLLRGSTVIGKDTIEQISTGATGVLTRIPVGSFQYLDVVVAGTYTYKVQACVESAAGTPLIRFTNCVLIAYEL